MRPLLLLLFLLTAGCTVLNPAPPPPASTPTPRPAPTATPHPDTPAGFSHLLDELERTPLADRSWRINRYEAQLTTTPLIGSGSTIFFWRGAAWSVLLTSDLTNWQPENALPLQKVPGTDLWWVDLPLASNARILYRFLVNEVEEADPRNPRTLQTERGIVSELVMPGYQATTQDRGNHAAGSLHEHTLTSAQMGQTRTFFVYQPASQLVGAHYPTLYLYDGSDWLTLGQAQRLLDTLIGSRVIPPVITIFVPPIDRRTEYLPGSSLADFVAQEVVPFVQQRYKAASEASRTLVGGTGTGGRAALDTALRYPELFGGVLGQSAVFSADDQATFTPAIRRLSPHQMRFFLVAGQYGTLAPEPGSPVQHDVAEMQQRLTRILQARNLPVRAIERPEGQGWGLWSATFGEGVAWLLQSEPR
jgi:enterochelin esterase family protein